MSIAPVDVSINLKGLHSGQVRVLAEAKRFNWLCAGRRWRKTSMCASICVAGHGQWRGAADGGRWLWAAPTHHQVRIGWDEMKEACKDLLHLFQFHETHATIYFPNGGRIWFRSLNEPNSTRGLTVSSGVVIDEYQDVPADAWSKVIQPMLVDTGGCAFMIFTPRGHNHAYQQWQAAEHDAQQMRWRVPLYGAKVDDGRLVREPHEYENPAIKWADLLTIWNDPNMDERTFRQEYLAEFLADGGGVFRGERVQAAAVAVPLDGPEKGHEYVMGVDVGRHHDFTWIRVLDVADQREVYSDRFSGLPYDVQKERVMGAVRVWRPSSVAIEVNGNEAFVEDLGRTMINDGPVSLNQTERQTTGAPWPNYVPVFPIRMTNPSKSGMIADLVLAFERSEIKIIDDAITKAELVAFESKRSKNSTVTLYSAPDGMHDDGVMSLALTWHALIKGRVVYAGGLW